MSTVQLPTAMLLSQRQAGAGEPTRVETQNLLQLPLQQSPIDLSLANDLLNYTETGLVALDAAGRIIMANAAARDLLGLSDLSAQTLPEAAIHLSPADRERLVLRPASKEPLFSVVTTRGVTLSVRSRENAGGTLLSFSPAELGARPPTPIPAIQLDSLTGLIGRQLFNERLEALCKPGRELSVLIIDLDCFKIVNDTLGHAAGDALLRLAAARLRANVRGADVISCLGGDEFAIVMPSHTEIAGVAARIVTILSRPYLIDKQVATIGASAGFALFPDHGQSPAALLRAADIALHQAKAEGRGRVCRFDVQLGQRARNRHALADELRRAIPLGQFLLHFQPQISLSSGALTGFEALVRWNHPERGMIPPDQFIPLAEDMNLINALGEWVMREACHQAVTWPSDVAVAVNVSPKQLLDGARLPAMIQNTLTLTGLDPARLEIEITETALMQETESLKVLLAIRALGVQISMDDFGTGYSSLSQLRRFPFDKLKIDRSFVSELATDQGAAGVVRAISALGQSLGMITIAEGVETLDQEAICRADGCTGMQGYLVSRPVPADQVADLIERLSHDTQAGVHA